MTDVREINPYQVLGVPPDASLHAIARAWRRKAKENHPDVTDDPSAASRMVLINAAWKTLSDPHARLAWDRAHAVTRSRVAHANASPVWATGNFTVAAAAAASRHPPPSAPTASSGRGGWATLALSVALLIALLVSGLISAASRDYDPSQVAPSIVRDNIRR